MKKLIITAFAAMLGIAANAAAVQWSMSNITASPDNAAAAGWAAYFMDGSTYAAFSALEGADAVQYAVDNALYTGETKNNRGKYQVLTTSGDYKVGDSVSGYMVLFDAATAADAKNYAFTTVENGTVGDAGADVIMNFGTFADATSSTGGWQTTAVPEPTSGLLMLIGLAGLALRRRRA